MGVVEGEVKFSMDEDEKLPSPSPMERFRLASYKVPLSEKTSPVAATGTLDAFESEPAASEAPVEDKSHADKERSIAAGRSGQ